MLAHVNNRTDARPHIHRDTSIINAHSCTTNVPTLTGRYAKIMFLQQIQTPCTRSHKYIRHCEANTQTQTHTNTLRQQIGFMDTDSELQNNVDATTEERVHTAETI